MVGGIMALEPKPMPEKVIKAFVKLGNEQRGKPEQQMVKIQHLMGGGVFNPVVEHVGDLTHRMTHMLKWLKPNTIPDHTLLGHEFVEEKVKRIKTYLGSPYGFEREFQENIAANVKFKNYNVEDYINKLKDACSLYSKYHQELPVYNQLQHSARQAAIYVGRWEFDLAYTEIVSIVQICRDKEQYALQAGDFKLNSSGNLIIYRD